MQRPHWEKRGLRLPRERKKKKPQLKAKMQRRKGKNKFVWLFLSQFNVIVFIETCMWMNPDEDNIVPLSAYKNE